MFSFRAISSSLSLFPSYRVPLALLWFGYVLFWFLGAHGMDRGSALCLKVNFAYQTLLGTVGRMWQRMLIFLLFPAL